jgi:hypothetical protein
LNRNLIHQFFMADDGGDAGGGGDLFEAHDQAADKGGDAGGDANKPVVDQFKAGDQTPEGRYDFTTDPAGLKNLKLPEGTKLAGRFVGDTLLDAVREMEKGYGEAQKALSQRGAKPPEEYKFPEGVNDEDKKAFAEVFKKGAFTQVQADQVFDMLAAVSGPLTQEMVLEDLSDLWKADAAEVGKRMGAINIWAREQMGEEAWKALRKTSHFQTAEGVATLYTLMQSTAGKKLYNGKGDMGRVVPTRAELDAMNGKLATMNPNDPGYQALKDQITDGFRAVYGDAKPANMTL